MPTSRSSSWRIRRMLRRARRYVTQPCASLQQTFAEIDEYAKAHGITPEEGDAAIDEAMEHVRPRKADAHRT